MLVAHFKCLTTYEKYTFQWPALQAALSWIINEGFDKTPGKHTIDGALMYVDVQNSATQPRETLRFESHRKYIDVQYCISGGEIIEWAPTDSLHPLNEYSLEKDVRHYTAPATPATSILMKPGMFAIFFPEDAHMPKVHDGKHDHIEKGVVKVSLELLKRT